MNGNETFLAAFGSGEDDRAEAAVHDLVNQGRTALPLLQELLKSGDKEVRWWAVRALAELNHPQAPRLLIEALADPETSVRQCAALGLRHRPTPGAVPALAAALEYPDGLLVSLAADALAAAGEEAVPALLRVLERGGRTARLAAVRALAVIADPRAVPALLEALEEDSLLMDYWAREGLERMGVGMKFFKP